jgi:mono/diheme cytochrome c family protein
MLDPAEPRKERTIMKTALFSSTAAVLVATITAASVLGGVRVRGAAQAARSVRDGVYTKAQADRGVAVYRGECARCHGEGLIGSESGPPLVGDAFLGGWGERSVADLFQLIRETMPQDSPGRLTPQQNAEVVAYILAGNEFPVGQAELPAELTKLETIRFRPPHGSGR